ncbi:MAG: DNA polymerase III subunit gamma/tau [Bacteroidota bacterium]|nr:DNA polymerase III subunit gamma/tau [Bacteroidota bacterium]
MASSQYLVTARKYRPQVFEDLVAQSHVVQTLINALKLGRLAHAYLFTGPRGVGKTTAARILAKAINCMEKSDGEVEPCLNCDSCKDFETQRSLNIFEIDAASNNRVEDIRELRENVRVPPQGGRRKVYIIDEVHMLTTAAFNALLKTLEEPPPHVLFIFATTEPHKVLPTILSRCQRFDFRRIPTKDIVDHLGKICKSEGVTADEDALHLIANKGDGALRDALSVFDQAVALCGSNLKYSTLAGALRVVDVELYFEATRYIAQREAGPMLSLTERIMSDGHDVREFFSGLAEHVRNLLIAVTLGTDALIDVSKRLRARYVEAADEFTETVLLRILMVIDEAQSRLPTSTSTRLAVELAMVKMVRLGDSVDLSDALAQIRRLERMVQHTPVQRPVTATAMPLPTQNTPPPRHTPPSGTKPAPSPRSTGTTSDTPHTSAPQSHAIGGESVLDRHRRKKNTPEQTHHSPVQPQQGKPQPDQIPQPDLEEAWSQVLTVLAKHNNVQGVQTMMDSRAINTSGNTLKVAVANDIVQGVARDGNMLEAIKKSMQSISVLNGLEVDFVVRPELFPSMNPDWNAEIEKLKRQFPSLRLLTEALDLRLANNPTP